MSWDLPLWLLSPSDRAFRRWRLEHWLDTAVSCGLRVMDSSKQTASRLQVEVRAGPVTVRIEEPRSKSSGLRVTAVFPGPPGFSRVRIRRLAPGPPETRELESGDERFDGTFSIEGPRRLLGALLDAEVRRLLVSVKPESRLEISLGELRLESSDEDLPNVLPFVLDLARRFTQLDNAEIARRLADNASRDPEAGVRLRNLRLLIEHFPGYPETVNALRATCSDPTLQVRLQAALELGSEGRDVLLEIAESVEDDAASAQAISRLGRKLPFERAQAILDQALHRRLLQTARACLEALGKSGDPAAEPPLLLALQREPKDLQIAAAKALSRVGTAAAVLPLKEVEGTAHDPELRRAARQAIAEIQSRIQGASPGQLSLAAAEMGQLSLAQAEAGQLSLAADAAGQLSLPSGEPGQLSFSDTEESPKPTSGGAA